MLFSRSFFCIFLESISCSSKMLGKLKTIMEIENGKDKNGENLILSRWSLSRKSFSSDFNDSWKTSLARISFPSSFTRPDVIYKSYIRRWIMHKGILNFSDFSSFSLMLCGDFPFLFCACDEIVKWEQWKFIAWIISRFVSITINALTSCSETSWWEDSSQE